MISHCTNQTETSKTRGNYKRGVEKFWRPIWEDMKEVKLDADWINTVTNTIKEQISVSHSENISLKKDNIWKCIRKKRDWTSPGKDKVTNFWLKIYAGYTRDWRLEFRKS